MDAKVYVLSSGAHEDWNLLGIYSSRENAERARDHYERPHEVEWLDVGLLHQRTANEIQEILVDRAWADGPQDWPQDKPHEPFATPPPADDEAGRLRELLRRTVERYAPHSSSCCIFSWEGKSLVTAESCQCEPLAKEARAALAHRPDGGAAGRDGP
jgi:hypothetical protein